MGKVTEQIRKIQMEEEIDLLEVFKRYPHLARMQFEELQEEKKKMNESKERQLLCD
jgi:hypothetical protein